MVSAWVHIFTNLIFTAFYVSFDILPFDLLHFVTLEPLEDMQYVSYKHLVTDTLLAP
jgi:hypothetical protein